MKLFDFIWNQLIAFIFGSGVIYFIWVMYEALSLAYWVWCTLKPKWFCWLLCEWHGHRLLMRRNTWGLLKCNCSIPTKIYLSYDCLCATESLSLKSPISQILPCKCTWTTPRIPSIIPRLSPESKHSQFNSSYTCCFLIHWVIPLSFEDLWNMFLQDATSKNESKSSKLILGHQQLSVTFLWYFSICCSGLFLYIEPEVL